jgi:hypothetical protein
MVSRWFRHLSTRALNYGAAFGDSEQGVRALELFLKQATPAATANVNSFLTARGGTAGAADGVGPARAPATVDHFLLASLHRDDALDGAGSAFDVEFRSFATGAIATDRANVAGRAWAQHAALGGDGGAPELLAAAADAAATKVAAGDDESEEGVEGAAEQIAEAVWRDGVARVDGALSTATASAVRATVLAARDGAVAIAAADARRGADLLSRVLSPKDRGEEAQVTRWEVRLPWGEAATAAAAAGNEGGGGDDATQAAVRELLGGSGGSALTPLGVVLHALGGGGAAMLWEYSALISAPGAAPQIVHADTQLYGDGPVVFTLLVALQDVARRQGPTRFLPQTHTGPAAARAHAALASEEAEAAAGGAAAPYCAGARSAVALLRQGDAVLYDSQVHHCGGPHSAPGDNDGSDDGPAPALPERAMLCLSFRHVRAEADSAIVLEDRSMRPEVASLALRLSDLCGTEAHA